MPTEPLARVRPEWVDHYGHMNLAYYLVVFDMATDALWPRLGLGPGFRARGLGTFAAESWQAYLREVTLGAPLACDSEVLAFDAKRLLLRHRMRHAEEGWEVAENEVLYLCVDLGARRVAPWPEDVLARFAAVATGNPARRLRLNPRAGAPAPAG
ncbi:acyl-CoA thioesterase [Caldovatus aquaticus]|uniref:Thioesterase family protein n=1 Tax=Caldovatus aquaticus TaxID=2865671 RepID=A0ABS7EZ68_9PROT|nr:thioesterase family protein [Caldovatus aquaticus]MBW8268652.1 thioesterase family protein [Caldovatus aquaticus]